MYENKQPSEKGIKFRINNGEETRPVIEEITFPLSENESLFNEQYRKVFDEIETYLSLRPAEEKEESYTNKLRQNEQINNIMAFIGERGSGKTSCMMSVANALVNKPAKAFPKDSQIGSTAFHTIDLIDPSFFDEKNNILSIIIAKLFRKFKDYEKQASRQNESCFDKKQRLVEKFQRVQAGLNCMIGGNTFTDDDLEQLVNLSASVNICADIKELVECYLEYMHEKKDMLLIMVDDIDVNTQQAHVMVEQIRKYFIHPNVIILLAVKMDQLANVMKRQYSEEFKTLLQKQMSYETIEEMVDRYLSKLIPHPQRIFLPDMETFFESPLAIIYRSENGEKAIRRFNTIREAVPMLIFEKTRYLFYNSRGTTSYIVPRNLRELRHIIDLLWNLEDYGKEKRNEYNKVLFRKYFYETWTSNNLDQQGRELIKNVLEITDAVLINKSVIGLLKKRFASIVSLIHENTPESRTNAELKLILREDNVTYNISTGDVMGFIYYLENISEKVEDQKLLFMIKSIYSIRLYEYYDQLTEDQPNKTNLEKEVKKNDYLKNLPDYQKIAGGSFINSALSSIMPASTETGRRDRRIINGELFYTLLNGVTTTPKPDTIEISENRFIDYKTAMILVEFFALTISYRRDSKYQHRVRQEIYFNENLENQRIRNLCFDIASFTYNLAFIKEAYSRFHPELYNLCIEHQESLLNRINFKTKKRFPDDKEHSWMSWVSIRNAEVLQDFVLYLQNNRPKGDKSSLEVIRNFFLSAAEFDILTYDFDEDSEKNHNISFRFLRAIAHAIKDISAEVFEYIFTEHKKLEEGLQQELPVNNEINLNTRLNLRGHYYQKIEIWNKLINKNPELTTSSHYYKLFNTIFDKEPNSWYPTKEVNNLLEIYRLNL